jgi:cardiolipin synthase
LTAAFLEQWQLAGGENPQQGKYLVAASNDRGEGYVQPYLDNPLSGERTAENVYLNLIGRAKDHIYFMTPYLIITDELSRALGLAAKRGVDVRIITPGIPDKKTVYRLTRSYYWRLAEQGVRIYEYTPGFLHAKQCVCDGVLASIGTSNLDYRSLYLHFENDVLLYNCQAVKDMEADFRETLARSREVTEDYMGRKSGVPGLWDCILRLFAPMM